MTKSDMDLFIGSINDSLTETMKKIMQSVHETGKNIYNSDFKP